MHTLEVIADPVRTGILDALAARDRTVTEIVSLFDVTQPGISRHLRILREAGLVTAMPQGRTRVYRLDARPLREVDEWLSRFRKFWASNLDALEHHMDEDPE